VVEVVVEVEAVAAEAGAVVVAGAVEAAQVLHLVLSTLSKQLEQGQGEELLQQHSRVLKLHQQLLLQLQLQPPLLQEQRQLRHSLKQRKRPQLPQWLQRVQRELRQQQPRRSLQPLQHHMQKQLQQKIPLRKPQSQPLICQLLRRLRIQQQTWRTKQQMRLK